MLRISTPTPKTDRPPRLHRLACAVGLLLLLLAPASGLAVATTALKNQTCIGYRKANTTCTAGEFTVNPVFSAAPGTSPFCVAGTEFNFLVELYLSGTNTDRYDVGFFVGQQQNDPRAATAGDICSVATFPTSPAPWEDNDGNACGDFNGRGVDTVTIDEIKVVCGGDSLGNLQIPYVLTYGATTTGCTGPADATVEAPSKCNAGTAAVSGVHSIFAGAYIDVTKQTVPDGDPQPFTFTASGPSGAKVIAQVGTTSTPSNIDGTYANPQIQDSKGNWVANPDYDPNRYNSTTIDTLSDGQTARFYINALSGDQLLTITEAATTNWETTVDLSCASTTGVSPTTDSNNRTISANLNTSNKSAACTITNTKRSRITLVKSVSGRAHAADQFTVKLASGGGAPTGTTAVTTVDAETSASTTFWSTPNTALTISDTMAAGSPTPLSSYTTTLVCSNAFVHPEATPDASLPGGEVTSASFTPKPGDNITCTFTNTPKPTLSKLFSPATIDQGETATLTFTLSNGGGSPAQSGLAFIDTLPANVVVAATPNLASTCPSGTGVVTAAAGAGSISVSGATMSAGQASCTISVDVTSSVPGGPYNNTSASISGLTRLLNGVATSGLTVLAKPTLSKAFSTGTVGVGQPAALIFTLTNPAGAPARSSGLTFTDTLPTGLVIAAPSNVVNGCGGTPTITATPGSGSFTVGGSGLQVATDPLAPTTCTIRVDVSSLTPLSGYVNGAAQITLLGAKLLNGVTDQTLIVRPPDVTVLKSLTTLSDPTGGGTPYSIPGALVRYSLVVGNFDTFALDNNSLVLTDPIPAGTSLVVTEPVVTIVNNPAATGLTMVYNHRGDLTDQVEFSSDGSNFATYIPIDDGSGVAPAVTHLRIRPTGAFLGGGRTFTVSFTVRLQ